jgi:polyhydroxyalkanoate synthesis regulator phasin
MEKEFQEKVWAKMEYFENMIHRLEELIMDVKVDITSDLSSLRDDIDDLEGRIEDLE